MLSYIVTIPIFVALSKIYKNSEINIRRLEIVFAFILIFVGLLILQELLLGNKSLIAKSIFEILEPTVGIAGIIITMFSIFIISLQLLYDISISSIINSLKPSENELFAIKKSDILANDQKEEKSEEKRSNIGEKIFKESISNLTTQKPQQADEILKEEPKEDIAEDKKKEQKIVAQQETKEVQIEEDEIEDLSLDEYIHHKTEELLSNDELIEEKISQRKVNLVVENIKNIKKFQQQKKEEEKEHLVIEESAKEVIEPIKKEEPIFEPKETKKYIEEKPHNDVIIVKELEENRRLQDEVDIGDIVKPNNFQLPPSSFLKAPDKTTKNFNETEIDEKIEDLLEKLKMFKIEGDVIRTYSGPVVTTFEFKPAAHIKVSRILNLQDDIAMALKATTIRLQAPIPGKDVVGIEIPNNIIDTIYLREIIESEIFQKAKSPLTIILGKDIVGNPFITDLKKLPHLLIAGTTGSGKSVGINAMILSLLYKNSPDRLRLIMVDPKMLEFSIYNDIPHLLTPVITKPKQAITAMANMVNEMERRYTLMSHTKTKNIESYNEKAIKDGFDEMPYIVIIIDELADLMMQGGKEVEISIARLAQMARASGIHLVVATQRPSTDVITGLIKANLPSRLSFRVGSKIDSKVILDGSGADSLLGKGDMLFTPPGTVGLVRLHAPWSTEEEIEKITDFIRDQRPAEYDHSFLEDGSSLSDGNNESLDPGTLDEMYNEAKEIVLNERKSSISYIQRRLQIGYNRAARIVEQLEANGVLGEQNSKGQREIIV